MKNRSLEEWQQFLKEDFFRITGRECQHFFCPILLCDCDENTHLSLGHVVNEAFGVKPERKIAQRKDVENFYGSFFEADFLDIEEIEKLKNGEKQPVDLLNDRRLETRFKLKFYQDNRHVKHIFTDKNNMPANFLPIPNIGQNEKSVFGFLVDEDFEIKNGVINCEIEFQRDIRVEAIASSIKAAHLTMFYMLNYQYVFQHSGHFMACILGWFFNEYKGKKKSQITNEAKDYFSHFVNMVRPFEGVTENEVGTINNGNFFVCMDEGNIWAAIVKVRTTHLLYGVLIPTMDTEENIKRFFELMNTKQTVEIAVRDAEFDFDKGILLINESFKTISWQISPDIMD